MWSQIVKIARYYEWLFGTILLTTLGVILSLEYLNGFSQRALMIGLLLFFMASLVKQYDEASRGDK
jgi:hypothetical protein